jgi:hypothetical protein
MVQSSPGKKKVSTISTNKKLAWWHTPVTPAMLET